MTSAQGWTLLGLLGLSLSAVVTLVVALMVSLRGYLDARFDTVDARFDAVDVRFGAVDARFDAVDRRLDALDRDVQGLGNRVFRDPP